MTRWTALDWFVIVTPFVILAGFAAHAIRRGQRRCQPCGRRFGCVADRARHERIAHNLH